MNHTKTLALTLIAFAVVASGCTTDSTAGKNSENLADSTGTEVANANAVGTAFWTEQRSTEQNQQNLIKAEPIPTLEDSLERENLKRRYDTLNDRDRTFHVYLISYGEVMAYYTAQGKVSSVNSKLTQPEQVWQIPNCDPYKTGNNCWVTTESPQLDGSYGTNGDGKFFFDTAGNYIESNLKYIVSERPLNIRDKVQLTREVG